MAYSEEIASKVCERIALGEPLRQICRDEGMPSYGAIYDWLEVNTDFASRFARARVKGFDAIADDAMTIADTPELGVETVKKPDGSVEVREGDMLGHRKLRIETRLKLLAKWDPRRYGEKLQTEFSGNLGVTVQASPTDEGL